MAIVRLGAGIAFVLLCVAGACWAAYLRGVYEGSKECDAVFEAGVRAGRAAGESAGMIAGLVTASARMIEFGRMCLAAIGVAEDVQEAVLKSVAQAMEDEAVAEAAGVEQATPAAIERLYKRCEGDGVE